MFRNSSEIGRLFGIKIRVHWTMLLLAAWIFLSGLVTGGGSVAAVTTLIFVAAIFACVLFHEIGHALAARQFGIATHDITLLPIGGVAALTRMPKDPLQELWIAAAGPLVNVAIATLIFAVLTVGSVSGSSPAGHFFWQLGLVNVALVLFNMIPAFPMDGGRILRALLAMIMNHASATRIAATVGQVSAVGLGLLGLFSGNFMLVLVAGFVYLAARAEMVRTGMGNPNPIASTTSQFDDSRWQLDQAADIRHVDSVPATLSVSSVAGWLASQHREACNVVDRGRIIGRITLSQLIVAMSRGMGQYPVAQLVVS